MHERKKSWPLFPPQCDNGWRPSADVFRTRDGWLLKFDLAGVSHDDVTVSIRGRFVTVAGQRRDAIVEEGFSHYSMEITYSRFERTIEMPCSLENASVAVQARDGFLLVRMVNEGKQEGNA